MADLKPITREQLEAANRVAYVEPETVRQAMSRVPPSWRLIEKLKGGGAFRHGSIQVLYTVSRYPDGRIWVHASACCRTPKGSFYLPSWDDMKRVKHDFVGPDKWAYQVFPSEAEYVNQHASVLHLYALLDGAQALTDFTYGLGTI